MEWISVEDRLPQERKKVLVTRDYNNAPINTAYLKGGIYITGLSPMDSYTSPTHWMPLPEPPNKQEE